MKQHLMQYEKLCLIVGRHKTAVIREKGTRKEGIASLSPTGEVALFYGNDDGSDDCILLAEEFDQRFEIIGEEV